MRSPLFLTFTLHRNVHRFTQALQKAILSAWPVIVIYYLYAGVAGLIRHTNVGEKLAGAVAAVSTPYTFPLLTAAVGAVFALFIPSSGGQWAIQGFILKFNLMRISHAHHSSCLILSGGTKFQSSRRKKCL